MIRGRQLRVMTPVLEAVLSKVSAKPLTLFSAQRHDRIDA
jgi:hypothetical protein